MSNIVNKVKNAFSDNHHTTTDTAGTTYTDGTGYKASAPGVTEHDVTGSGPTHTAEGVAGPHHSRIANTIDPRVDSDLDGSTRIGGTTGTTATAPGAGYTPGPHSSSIANKLDPRVNSTTGQTVTGTTGPNTTGTTGIGHTGDHHVGRDAALGGDGVDLMQHEHNKYASAGTGSGLGPHSSSLLNKLDPWVDSTTGMTRGSSTGRTTTGTTSGITGTNNYPNTGTVGGISSSTNAGPHNSNLANKLDPSVDSDLDGRGNRHGAATGGVFGSSGSHATPGYGTAQNTAGPHDSDLANQLDPRVDSNLDGSTTMGPNRTYAPMDDKNFRDAAIVPPSVFREHVGYPEISHGDSKSDYQRRHGSISSQVADRHI